MNVEMTRSQWIEATVEKEVARACAHAGAPDVLKAFREHDHSNSRAIEIRWLNKDGKVCSKNMYTVTTPKDNVLYLNEDKEPYVPDGPLPPAWAKGSTVEVVVFPDGVDPSTRDRCIVAPTSEFKSANENAVPPRRVIDASVGAYGFYQ